MQNILADLTLKFGPVASVTAAALCLILGVAVIVFPPLLAWLAGIGLILFGVALLATIFLLVADQQR